VQQVREKKLFGLLRLLLAWEGVRSCRSIKSRRRRSREKIDLEIMPREEGQVLACAVLETKPHRRRAGNEVKPETIKRKGRRLKGNSSV